MTPTFKPSRPCCTTINGMAAVVTDGELYPCLQAANDHSACSCSECPWFAWCAGGCPALGALAHGGDMLAPDPTSCEFFHNGWPERFAQALAPWHCLNPPTEIPIT